MLLTALLPILAVPGCDPEERAGDERAASAADSGPVAPASVTGDSAPSAGAPSGAAVPAGPESRRPDPIGVPFDPRRIRPGDRVAGLEVVTIEAARTSDSLWVGSARFGGERTIGGVYQPHFDFPEARFACFHLDSASAASLPRWPGDARKPWLCFRDLERSESVLGALEPGRGRAARIVVDDYAIHYSFTDVFNTATLVRVDTLGAEGAATLRSEWFGRAPPN